MVLFLGQGSICAWFSYATTFQAFSQRYEINVKPRAESSAITVNDVHLFLAMLHSQRSSLSFRHFMSGVLLFRQQITLMNIGNHALPLCTGVVCPKLGELLNGKVNASDSRLVYQTVVTFTCDSLFSLDGNETLRCLLNGSWSSQMPTCRRDGKFIVVIIAIGSQTYCGEKLLKPTKENLRLDAHEDSIQAKRV